MSRHRFVRNLDLDAEMEEEEEEDGMTAEQQAQMKTSMPIARALLKDIKPPISDNAIADSLWHYYFDVDKAVSWLRKDWEKKGEAAIPDNLLPTPDEAPRRRTVKRQRLETPEPPLTALQRLSLSRQNGSQAPSSSTSAQPDMTRQGDGTPTAKPKSKLALLAEQRRAAAAAKSQLLAPESSVAGPSTPLLQATPESSPSKPLSKLAQKMAAARAAKASAAESRSPNGEAISADASADLAMTEEVDEIDETLFPHASTSPASKPDSPSRFFGLLTTAYQRSALPSSTLSMHLPANGHPDDLERRVRSAFGPDVASPDDIVLRARQAAKASASSTPRSASLPGKPRAPNAPKATTPTTQPNSPAGKSRMDKSASNTPPTVKAGTSSSSGVGSTSHDLAGLHLDDQAENDTEKEKYKEKPGLSMKQEELLAKVRKEEEESDRKNISLIVVGHVDAGKSTLMGRLLYEVGELSEKEKTANERSSKKIGKGSFAFAWGLDALGDERDRGVTIDIATTHFSTPHRNITLLDAPGHRDFIPAMISGAAQADVALMVVDGSPGEFEAGFERGGQTREHAWLVRSLGVKEIVVGINKMDLVNWSQDRYDEIVEALKPFLVSAGFAASKTTFMPLAAMEGVNVMENNESTLKEWFTGLTLMDALDKVEVPSRPYDAPFRIPLSNVFKGQTAVASGVAVSGRLCSGIVQVGDRVRSIPGDEVGSIRTIEVDDDSAPYAVAGQNVTLYLSGIDPIHLAIGSVLCPTSQPVPLVTRFTVQILVFDLQSPIITGTAVELFHHSVNLPATISKLLSVNEKGGSVRQKPRVLQKGVTATVEVSLRALPGSRVPSIPLETAADNKEMGRVLIRRGGETIAAGVVLETFS